MLSRKIFKSDLARNVWKKYNIEFPFWSKNYTHQGDGIQRQETSPDIQRQETSPDIVDITGDIAQNIRCVQLMHILFAIDFWNRYDLQTV